MVDMMFAVRRLQKLARKDTPLHMCFAGLSKACFSVDRNILLCAVLACYDVGAKMLVVIPHIHDGMRKCMRLDHGVFLGMFDVEQGLR